MIFLLFVFFLAIVVLNMMNGLAVYDTKKIRKMEDTLILVATARMASNALHGFYVFHERLWWPKRFSLRYEPREEMFVLYPNKPNQIVLPDLESLRRIITKKREMNKKWKSMENVENWSLLSEQLSELQFQFYEMRNILIEILNK